MSILLNNCWKSNCRGRRFDSLFLVKMNCYADYMKSLVHQVWIRYSCAHCKANSCTIGRHCCLFWQIDSKSLSIPRQEQGTHRDCTLQTLQDDFSGFTRARGNIKKAKMFNNVISLYHSYKPGQNPHMPSTVHQQ